MKRMEDLPDNARNYLEEIERLTGVSVSIFSVGPDRNQTNLLKDFWN